MPGWLGSIAEDEKTGVLVMPDDPADFADRVIWMRDHPRELDVFRNNARRVAEEQFSRDILARRLEAVFRQAVVPAPDRPSAAIASAEEGRS
jgi:glycosyltransferase involved in cell wall biosynthesis